MFHSADIKKKFLERIEYKTKNAYFYETNFEMKVKSYFLVYSKLLISSDKYFVSG